MPLSEFYSKSQSISFVLPWAFILSPVDSILRGLVTLYILSEYILYICVCIYIQCKKMGKLLQFRRAFELYSLRPFHMFTGHLFQIKLHLLYCRTQWISTFDGSFEILWVRQYLVHFMGLAGIVNATVCKTEPIFEGSRNVNETIPWLQLYV